MARDRTRGGAATTGAAKAKPRRASATDATREADEIAALRASRGALTDVQRRAFARQQSEDACRRLGTRTRGAGVLAEALDWARKIEAKLQRPDRGGVPVTDAEAAWFYLAVEQLFLALQANRRDEGASTARADIAVARGAAREAATALLQRVRDAIGTDPAWRHALDAALATDATGDEDVTRGRALATRVEAWLGGEDAEAAAVLDGEGITAAAAAHVRALADALDAALKRRPAESAGPFDSPDVNLAEGRVLYAMRKLRRKVRAARAAGKTALVLRPGPATRHVIVTRAVDEEDAAPEPAPDGDPTPPPEAPAPRKPRKAARKPRKLSRKPR